MSYGKFDILIEPDEDLAKIIGKESVRPNEMIKKLWKYIKANKLMKKD